MISTLVLILGMAAPQTEGTVTHRILNTTVHSKFYVTVQLSSGYQTQIPVVNGYLPKVHSRTRNGRIYQLDLDYSKGVKYDPKFHRGIIRFTSSDKKPAPTTPAVRPLVPVQKHTIPLRDDDKEIDGLLRRLRGTTSEKQKKTRFVRPSDIGSPPREITPSYK